MSPAIVILTTLDTKGLEAAYVKQRIEQGGRQALLLDAGTLEPPQVPADIPRQQCADKVGLDLQAVRQMGRETVMASMGSGAGRVLCEMADAGELAGVLALGGNQGATIAAMAMQDLPFGLPKILVSTMSGNLQRYIGAKDILTMFSVADLLGGPNAITRPVLDQAVGAMLGMVEVSGDGQIDAENIIAVTALGNTHAAASAAVEDLRNRGFEPVTFHASGACGSAMEQLISDGRIAGVLDLTPHELTEEVVGDGIYVPMLPRLEAAGRAGIAQVVSTGSLEYICFGSPESIPAKYQDRKRVMHNPCNANVRTSREELERVGELLASRLNAARGPVALVVPLRGWSVYGSEGGPLHEPETDNQLLQTVKVLLSPDVILREIDCDINDSAFAPACVALLVELMEQTGQVRRP